jgi:hypothetical protein
MTAASAVGAILVVVAALVAAMLRAGAVLAAAGAVGTILVAAAMAFANAFEATAALGTTPVRIEPDQNVVDAAFQLAALTGAADPSLGTFVIGAAFSADRFVLAFAADQTVAAVELGRPVSASRRHLKQAAFVAEWNAAVVETLEAMRRFTADFVRIAATVTDVVGSALEARLAIVGTAAFDADQLIVNATAHLPQWAGNGQGLADAFVTELAAVAVRVLATLRAD